MQEASSDKFKSRNDLYDKYKQYKDIYSKESLKLYSKFRNISNKEVSLVIVKSHVRNTLNLVVATINKIVELKLNLKDIPVPNMIHLHKQTGKVIYNDLMKYTLKVSKLQSTVSKIHNHLR